MSLKASDLFERLREVYRVSSWEDLAAKLRLDLRITVDTKKLSRWRKGGSAPIRDTLTLLDRAGYLTDVERRPLAEEAREALVRFEEAQASVVRLLTDALEQAPARPARRRARRGQS